MHYIEYAPTTDGWELALYRYAGDRASILLCHGFACNRYNLDFEDSKYSLAKYLANKGLDVWVLELRGHGKSRKKGIKKWFNWCFDTYVNHDAPDAINYIKKRLAKEGMDTKIFWIGHSMGGMIAYAYGSTENGRKNLKGVITIASPVKFSGLFKNLQKEGYEWLINLVKIRCPHRLNQPFFTPLYINMKWSREIIEKFFVNRNNIDNKVLQKFWEIGIEIISCKKLYQFAFMLEMSDFCKFPKYPRFCKIFSWFCPESYIKNFKNFIAPLLVIAGNGDKVAIKEDVFKIKEMVGSKDITLKMFSKENSTADYGHLDLVLGINSEKEIFREIYNWIEERL